jgi:hypothetical protein
MRFDNFEEIIPSMKKAINITTSIASFFIVSSVFLKMAHIPGGAVLIILGVFLLACACIPLLAIYNLQKKETPLMYKVSQRVGILAGWFFSIGALFKIQSWPDAFAELNIGTVGIVLFVILYAMGLSQYKANEKKFTYSSLLILLTFGSLILGVLAIKPSSVSRQEFVAKDRVLSAQLSKLATANSRFYQAYHTLEKSGAAKPNSVFNKMNRLEENVNKLVTYLHEIRAELIMHANPMTRAVADTLSAQFIYRVTDYDTPTHFLIGSDPTHITGKSLDLLPKIRAACDSLVSISGLPISETALNLDPVSDVKGEVKPWAVAKFYHVELGQVLLTLKTIEIALKKAEEGAMAVVMKAGS